MNPPKPDPWDADKSDLMNNIRKQLFGEKQTSNSSHPDIWNPAESNPIDDIRRMTEQIKAESAEAWRRWWDVRIDDDGRVWSVWHRKEDDGTDTVVDAVPVMKMPPGTTLADLAEDFRRHGPFSHWRKS